MSMMTLRRNNGGIGFLGDIFGAINDVSGFVGDASKFAGSAAQVASAFGGDGAKIGSQIGQALNVINPITGVVNAVGGVVNQLFNGPANSQAGRYSGQAVSDFLGGGDVGNFFGGVVGSVASVLDTGVNVVANVADAVGVDTSKWFSDSHLEGLCQRGPIELEGIEYNSQGPDWQGNAYIWHGCNHDYLPRQIQNDAGRFLPHAKQRDSRDYTRGMIFGEFPDGTVGWREYAWKRWSDKSIGVKDSSYYSSGYATADIYRKHLNNVRRVRVPTGKVLWETGGHGGVKIADAVEKSFDAITTADVAMLNAYNAMPKLLAAEISTGKVKPRGEALTQEQSNVIRVGGGNNYTPDAAGGSQNAVVNALGGGSASGASHVAQGQPEQESAGIGIGALIAIGLGIYLLGSK